MQKGCSPEIKWKPAQAERSNAQFTGILKQAARSRTAHTVRYSSQGALRLFQSQIKETTLQLFALQKQTTLQTLLPHARHANCLGGVQFLEHPQQATHTLFFLLHVEKMSRICSDSTGALVCPLINPKQLHSSQLSHLPPLTKAVG